jgi:hypothetical protein
MKNGYAVMHVKWASSKRQTLSMLRNRREGGEDKN